MRTCSSCQTGYEHYGQRSSLCQECRRAYDRRYHANRSKEKKERKHQLQMELKRVNRQFVYDYLKEHPCEECGENRIACLQFDHINPSEKKGNIAQMKTSSIEKLKIEIAKCRVLCANCHAIRTAEQFEWYADLK